MGEPEKARRELKSTRTHFQPYFWPYEIFGLLKIGPYDFRPFVVRSFDDYPIKIITRKVTIF